MTAPAVRPTSVGDLTDDELLQHYAPPDGADPWVRFNFIASVDGAATLGGRSGGLGNAHDQRLLHLLRRQTDVLLIGAGTLRVEGYVGDLLGEAGQAWRHEHGRSGHPRVAVVSGRLDLDADSPFFTHSPVRPLILTTARADESRRRALEAVADVEDAGEGTVDPARVLRVLADRGHRLVHSEGGPTLFGSFLEARAVQELCLSLSPAVVGGTSSRIAVAVGERLQRMRLASVLSGDDLLLLRYLADPSEGVGDA